MRGAVNNILEKVYAHKQLNDTFGETKKRIIRIRLSLKTGLSMNKFSPDSEDSQEEVDKISQALKSPEFGLENFSFQ